MKEGQTQEPVKNKWPDEVRLKMIEKSEFYQEPKIYQYGFYDGYQLANSDAVDKLTSEAFRKKISDVIEEKTKLRFPESMHLQKDTEDLIKNEIVSTQEPVGGIKEKCTCNEFTEIYDCKKDCDAEPPIKRTPPPSPIKTEGEDESDFDLLAEYDMKEKVERIVTHVFTKVPEDNKVNFLTNYINGLVGSVILHHHNRYVKKINVPDFKTTFK